MLQHAHKLRLGPAARAIAPVAACALLALLVSCAFSTAALALPVPEALSEGNTTPGAGAALEGPRTPIAVTEVPTGASGGEAGGSANAAGSPAPAETPPPAGGSTNGGQPGSGASGSPPSEGSREGTASTPSPPPTHGVEESVGAVTPSSPAGSASGEIGSGAATGAAESAGSEAAAVLHRSSGGAQTPVAKNAQQASGAASAAAGESRLTGVAAAATLPPPGGAGALATAPGASSSAAPALAGIPVTIVKDTISASPFAPEQLALAGGPSSGTGGPQAHLIVAKAPAVGSLTLDCLKRLQTVRCELWLPLENAQHLGLAYAGSGNVAPGAQALAASADRDHLTPPPSGGSSVPNGSGALVGGSSSAASGAAGAAASGALLLAALLLLGSPRIMRRLLDQCERWLASPLALVLERPD